MYTIRFGRSTSSNYNIAVEIASGFPTYIQKGEGKDILHEITFEEDQLDMFFELYDIVSRWKSTSIYLDGERILQGRDNFLWCFRNRNKAYDKEEYCFNLDDGNAHTDNYFGCRFINANPLSWKGLQGFGQMDKSGTFYVDKDRLQHELDVSLKEYGACPAFDYQRSLRLLEQIPNKIQPNKHRDWEYVTDYTDMGTVAVAVKLKNSQSSGPLIETQRIQHDVDLSEIIEQKKIQPEPKPSPKPVGCASIAFIALASPLLLFFYNYLG